MLSWTLDYAILPIKDNPLLNKIPHYKSNEGQLVQMFILILSLAHQASQVPYPYRAPACFLGIHP
jgi:hypothetical protein